MFLKSPNKSINWGLVGLRKMADVFISTLNEIPYSNIKAIASKYQETHWRVSNRLSIKKKYCFNDYYDLIKCEEIDIVYNIAKQPSLPGCQKALENNKHVLVEKPTLRVSEMEILENLALKS